MNQCTRRREPAVKLLQVVTVDTNQCIHLKIERAVPAALAVLADMNLKWPFGSKKIMLENSMTTNRSPLTSWMLA
jgi:hypothetical protein